MTRITHDRRASLLLLAGAGAAVTAMLCGLAAQAQTQRSGGGEAQKFMQQYQQVSAEKTALQAQVTQLKKSLDTATADLATMKKERDAAKAHTGVPAAQVAQLTAGKETAEKNLETYKQRLQEVVDKYRELAGNLKQVESDRTKVKAELGEKNTAFDKCAEANLGLYDINNEILNRYERVGPFTKVSAAEPFTRITRTRIQNLVDEYRERALELRLNKTSP